MARLSVIMPVYDVGAALARCLDSLLAQTFTDWECICVDDGSRDSSGAILREYAGRDARFKVIDEANSGTVAARKRAVSAAVGEWALFLDPDDWLEPDAMEAMLAATEGCGGAGGEEPDIIECGAQIHESTGRTAAQHAESMAYFNPPAGDYAADTLPRLAFIERKLPWNLICRMVKMEICRPAFAEQVDAYFINETDIYALCHILARVKGVLRVIPKRLYNYSYGGGISTKPEMSLDEFRRTLGKFEGLAELRSAGLEPEVMAAISRQMAASSFYAATGRMEHPGDVPKALAMLMERVEGAELVRALAVRYAQVPAVLAKLLSPHREIFSLPPREVKHIALAYFHMTIGGVQKVLAAEARELVARGYKVTLLLDDNGEELLTPVPEGVEVVRIAPIMGDDADSLQRVETLMAAIKERKIDLLHSHQYLTPRLVWDILACKVGCGIPFYLHYHNVSTVALWAAPAVSVYTAEANWLRLADGVFVLSRLDEAAMRAEGISARFLANPPSPKPAATAHTSCGADGAKCVLWVGRLSAEKRPGDAIRVFSRLKRRLGDGVRFAMVGGGAEVFERGVRRQAADAGLEGCIDFAGSVADVTPYYAAASVLLATSDYEGWPLVIQEALAHGLKIVSYSQPQLELYKGNRLVREVPYRDIAAAATAIEDILKDESELAEGEAGASEGSGGEDFAGALLEVFVGRGKPLAEIDRTLSAYIELVKRGLDNLHERRTAQIRAVVVKRDALLKENAALISERERLTKANAAAQKSLEERKKEIVALSAERDQLKREKEDLSAAIAKLRGECAETLSRLNATSEKLSSTGSELETVTATLAKTKAALENTTKELEKTNATLGKTAVALAAKTKENARLTILATHPPLKTCAREVLRRTKMAFTPKKKK